MKKGNGRTEKMRGEGEKGKEEGENQIPLQVLFAEKRISP